MNCLRGRWEVQKGFKILNIKFKIFISGSILKTNESTLGQMFSTVCSIATLFTIASRKT